MATRKRWPVTKTGVQGPEHFFSSLTELVEFADRDAPRDRRTQSRSTSNASWYGSKSWEDAKALAFGGWKDGADRVQKRRAAVSALVSGGYRVEMARRGPGTLSMARYVSGHPRPYARMVTVDIKPKVIRVMVNICVSSATSAETIERRGGAVCALIDALEANGRSVELTVVSNHEYAAYYCTIKRAGQKLNLPTVAFAIAHPSMLRRVVFGAIEQEPTEIWQKMYPSYGHVANVTPPEETIYLGTAIGSGGTWDSDTKAAAWVTETAAQYGVTLS